MTTTRGRVVLVMSACAAALVLSQGARAGADECAAFAWPKSAAACESLEARFPAPDGFVRVEAALGTYAAEHPDTVMPVFTEGAPHVVARGPQLHIVGLQ